MIPVNTPLLGQEEIDLVNDCLNTGWISSEGSYVSEFERRFADYIGVEQGIAVTSGSAALDLLFECIVESGDEVILPTFTIISPAFSIIRAGGQPVLVDSDPNTWNMDVSAIEEKITDKTKAICVVHTYGLPVDMDPVLDLARKYGLMIIEDAAEAHGLEYKSAKCGSIGDASIFSFYPNKHITTGEGGMVLCKDENLAEQLRKKRNLSFDPEGRRFIHHEFGWNFRMTNIQAALGLGQLSRIDRALKRKREIGSLYWKHLSNVDGIQLPLQETTYAKNVYWVFGLVAENEDLNLNLQNELRASKIGTRPFFWGMHQQPVFNKLGLFTGDEFPVAEKLARCGFYLPSGLGISNDEILTVCQKILQTLR